MLNPKENAQKAEELLTEFFANHHPEDIEESFLHTFTEAIHGNAGTCSEDQFYHLYSAVILLRKLSKHFSKPGVVAA